MELVAQKTLREGKLRTMRVNEKDIEVMLENSKMETFLILNSTFPFLILNEFKNKKC